MPSLSSPQSSVTFLNSSGDRESLVAGLLKSLHTVATHISALCVAGPPKVITHGGYTYFCIMCRFQKTLYPTEIDDVRSNEIAKTGGMCCRGTVSTEDGGDNPCNYN